MKDPMLVRNWHFLGFLILVLFLGSSSPLFAAFEDEVDAKGEEIYSAACQVVQKDYGVRKANPKKKRVESKWKEDVVKRSRGMFKNILHQGVYRRYYLKVEIQGNEKMPILRVKGTFQERSTGSDANLPWQTVKMMAADHRLERELFFKILTQIEDNRKAASQPASPSPPPTTS
ncbi:MAG: hypothetical protein EXS63_04960 [Candidatus Omnitrophica bacterium]|nr:hypothetical protein [Candidatus Omnitrophota bacterium]